MQSNITMNMDFDFPEKAVALANLVFDVARECDTTRSSERSIDMNSFLDEISLQLEIVKVRHENPQLSEDEIQNLVDGIITENNRKKKELVAVKATKREKVKQYIKGNATAGYELAYSLCRNNNSDEAKALAYRMLSHLKNLPLEEKIKICHLYAESLIKLGKSGNSIARVYCDMATLVYPQNKSMDYSLCLSFYEKAYEHIDEPTWMLNAIIGFCNKFGVDELRIKCEQKKTAF